MAEYTVLWFDDEHSSLDMIREKAFQNGIILKGFDNAKTGIEELERHLLLYDAVIVDGLFYLESANSEYVNDKALFNVAVAIERLAERKVIPWFILSGQISFTKGNNRYAEGLKGNKVYDKLNEYDLKELWTNIKKEAIQQEDTQIRYKYKQVFEVCTPNYLGEKTAHSLLYAIKLCETSTPLITKEAFNSLRKILELLFSKLNKIGFIPDEIFNANGSFNKASYFLAGTHNQYKVKPGVIHPAVAHLLKQIVQVTQDASHNIQEKLKLNIDEFVSFNQTRYLYIATVNQLLDVLIWFKKFIDENKDPNINKRLYDFLENGGSGQEIQS